MARRNNAAAARAALLLTLQMWESLISANYMKEACPSDKLPCPTCYSPRVCYNYFCLQCKTGGLCPMVFRGEHEHRDHPWLQVRHYTRQYSVLSTDLEPFMNNEALKHIHTNTLNGGQRHCNLRSRKHVAHAAGSTSSSSSSRITRARVFKGEKSCQGCKVSIRGSKDSIESYLVCSLQCLIEVLDERSELKLLAVKDGAMERMEPPLLFNEKLLKPPRMLETALATSTVPTDEAPPQALPLPQATGDDFPFPMPETHESEETHESIESMLDALPFPFAPDEYPMFGTPEEADLGEVLAFPPAETDDSSVFGESSAPVAPAAPAETEVTLQTFARPTEVQALDLTPEFEAWCNGFLEFGPSD